MTSSPSAPWTRSALTGNPTTTFWKGTYKQHTRFAIESIAQPMNTAIAYGQSCQCMLNRVGNMICYLYLRDAAGIVACGGKAEGASCAGITGTQFPTFMDNGGACALRQDGRVGPARYREGDDYNDLSATDQAAASRRPRTSGAASTTAPAASSAAASSRRRTARTPSARSSATRSPTIATTWATS